jgi:hypothetical protein
MEQFKTAYNEEEILKFLEAHLYDGVFQASKVLEYNCTRSQFMMVVYCIILAVEKSYTIEIVDNQIETQRFVIKDFIIKKTLV